MKQAINILRAIIVSPEMVIIITAMLLLSYSPHWLLRVADSVESNREMLMYLVGIPVSVFVWVFSHSRKMVFPEADARRIFNDWPDYIEYKHVVIVGVLYSACFSIVAISTLAMDWHQSPVVPTIFLMGSILGSATTAFSMYNAEIAVNEMLIRGFGQNSSSHPKSR